MITLDIIELKDFELNTYEKIDGNHGHTEAKYDIMNIPSYNCTKKLVLPKYDGSYIRHTRCIPMLQNIQGHECQVICNCWWQDETICTLDALKNNNVLEELTINSICPKCIETLTTCKNFKKLIIEGLISADTVRHYKNFTNFEIYWGDKKLKDIEIVPLKIKQNKYCNEVDEQSKLCSSILNDTNILMNNYRNINTTSNDNKINY
jgi:hypothetical protein